LLNMRFFLSSSKPFINFEKKKFLNPTEPFC
jgi:hypothetical protein